MEFKTYFAVEWLCYPLSKPVNLTVMNQGEGWWKMYRNQCNPWRPSSPGVEPEAPHCSTYFGESCVATCKHSGTSCSDGTVSSADSAIRCTSTEAERGTQGRINVLWVSWKQIFIDNETMHRWFIWEQSHMSKICLVSLIKSVQCCALTLRFLYPLTMLSFSHQAGAINSWVGILTEQRHIKMQEHLWLKVHLCGLI